MPVSVAENEFDSAYHESAINAKKVHDLVQVGETRRFIDEIDYLLEGLQSTGSKSLPAIRSSLKEIVGKCFRRGTGEVDLAFGMKLKSHGALGTIFESLNSTHDDPVIFDNLLLLIAGLLYDVRRLDFFFKPQLAIQLAQHCLLADSWCEVVDKLKGTQVFTNLDGIEEWNQMEVAYYVGIWILFKWSFSSITTTSSNDCSFFDLLSKEPELLLKLIQITSDSSSKSVIREKSASLLDCLLNRKNFSMAQLNEHLTELLKIVIDDGDRVVFMKLAVSLSGSEIGKMLASKGTEGFFATIQDLMKLIPKGDDVEILALSCLVNLVDRCDDSLLDEFRYQKAVDSSSLLQSLTLQYNNENQSEARKALLALALGFICRQNQTNVQVMFKAANQNSSALKAEIYSVASKFLLQQGKSEEDSEGGRLINDRLKEIIMTFKPQQ